MLVKIKCVQERKNKTHAIVVALHLAASAQLVIFCAEAASLQNLSAKSASLHLEIIKNRRRRSRGFG